MIKCQLHKVLGNNASNFHIKADIIRSLENFLTSLRLHKKGDVGASLAYIEIKEPFIERALRVYYGAHFNLRSKFVMLPSGDAIPFIDFQIGNSFGVPYEFTSQDIDPLKNLYKGLTELEKTHKLRSLEVALRRFNQAYSRTRNEDKIIDLVIAIESCLLGDNKEEISYKFSLRGAALLAESTKRDVMNTKNLLHDIYNARSKIVHSGKRIAEIEKSSKRKKLVIECEDITRDILKAIIDLNLRNVAIIDIPKYLDEKILDKLK